MRGEWCYFRSYFSKDYCNSILERSKDLEFKKANLGEDGLTNIDGYRKSDITWLFPQDFPDLYDEIWKLEREANKNWFGFHIDNLASLAEIIAIWIRPALPGSLPLKAVKPELTPVPLGIDITAVNEFAVDV